MNYLYRWSIARGELMPEEYTNQEANSLKEGQKTNMGKFL